MKLAHSRMGHIPCSMMKAWIREAIEDGEHIALLSTKMWQNRIRMRYVTHVRLPDSGLCELNETNQESMNPEIDWEKACSELSVTGLSPAHKGFIFMMSNDLLPNNFFLYKIKKAESPQCSFCDKFDGRLHFLACLYSGGGSIKHSGGGNRKQVKHPAAKSYRTGHRSTSCPPRSVHPLRGWPGANGT